MSAVAFRLPFEMKLFAMQPVQSVSTSVIPGVRYARSNTLRPINGKSFTNLLSTTWPVTASCVCSSTAPACTSTTSEIPPTFMEKSTAAFWLTSMVTSSLRSVLKPDAVAETVYFAGGS